MCSDVHHRADEMFLSLDPLTPTNLEVTDTATSSVKVHWLYDTSKSHCVKYKIKYKVKTSNNDFTEVFTTDATVQEKTIDNLTPGANYIIYMYAVITDDIVSVESSPKEATISKY